MFDSKFKKVNFVMMSYTNRFFRIAWIAILLTGCNLYSSQSKTPVVVSPPASAFLLDSDVFPKGWTFESDEQGVIVAGRDFYLPNASGHSFQEVFRRPSENEASKKYKVYLEGEFNKSFTSTPEITFKSKIADEYYFACGVDVVPSCKMLARYHNYFVYFYFDLITNKEPGGLTYSEIEHVLKALESKVSDAFNTSTLFNLRFAITQGSG
jgi:hypothetical protein